VIDVEMDAALRTWQGLARAKQAEAERLLKAVDVAEKNTEDRQREVERLRAVLDQLANELEGTQYGNVAELLTEVERLRVTTGYFYNGRTAEEWAEEVERLRAEKPFLEVAKLEAEVERLRAERDELVARLGRMEGEYLAAPRMILERDREVERLRAALERIAWGPIEADGPVIIARDAIAREEA
jgi:DNA repair exonuclease SbcCD ATPase subunit